jgi:hypothetical protein
MGGEASVINKTDQEIVNNTVTDVLSSTNITNTINNVVNNNSTCSSISSNEINIGSGNQDVGGNVVIKMRKANLTQKSTANLTCFNSSTV